MCNVLQVSILCSIVLKICSSVIVVLKLLCKREWSDLDVGLVKSGQKTLQSLSCICIFSQESLQASTWVSLWNLWVLFSVIPALKSCSTSHLLLTGNWEQSSISNYLAAGYVFNSVKWNERVLISLTTCRYYVKSFHLKPWNYTRSLLFHLGRKSLWYERLLWRCA